MFYTTAIMEHHLYSLLSTNLSLLSSYVQTQNQIFQVVCTRNFLFLWYFQMLIIVRQTSGCLKSQLYQRCENFINSTNSSKNILNNVSCLTNSVTENSLSRIPGIMARNKCAHIFFQGKCIIHYKDNLSLL